MEKEGNAHDEEHTTSPVEHGGSSVTAWARTDGTSYSAIACSMLTFGQMIHN